MDSYPVPPVAPSPPPIRRPNAPTRPVLTYILLGLTVFIYLLQVLGQALQFDLVTVLGIKYNDYIRQGEIWRLITPVFLHGSILHIAMNMYGLFIFGPALEMRFGRGRFFLLYFLSAYAGNVLSFLLNPSFSLGASTAIFGLIAAEGMYLFQNRQLLSDRGRARITNIVVVAGYNLLYGLVNPSIDNWGHIGGLLGGLIFTWFGGPRLHVEGIYPTYQLVDERQGHGALSGTAAVLLFFIPLTILGWIWPVG
jgi:rhomboid protease GluP